MKRVFYWPLVLMKKISSNAQSLCLANQYLSLARSLYYLLIRKVLPSFSHAGLKNRLGKSVFWAHCLKASNLFSFYLIHLRKDDMSVKANKSKYSVSPDEIEFSLLENQAPFMVNATDCSILC